MFSSSFSMYYWIYIYLLRNWLYNKFKENCILVIRIGCDLFFGFWKLSLLWIPNFLFSAVTKTKSNNCWQTLKIEVFTQFGSKNDRDFNFCMLYSLCATIFFTKRYTNGVRFFFQTKWDVGNILFKFYKVVQSWNVTRPLRFRRNCCFEILTEIVKYLTEQIIQKLVYM